MDQCRKAFDTGSVLWQLAQIVDMTTQLKGMTHAQRRMGRQTRLPDNRQAFL